MKPLILGLAAVLALSACQVQKAPDFDYTSFKESKPASILVVPPLNESPDVNGTWGVLASTAAPLSEAGYYVFPAAVVEETFKQNGLTNAADIHAVRPEKLHQIFGNDAVLYITVTEYGTSYQILDSVTTVSAKARLVDSREKSCGRVRPASAKAATTATAACWGLWSAQWSIRLPTA